MGWVIVVGSINVDLVVTAARFPRPGETVPGESFVRHPGGKGANQAIAAARLGASTMLAGVVGDDADGVFMRGVLARAGVDAGGVRAARESPTGVALITVAGGENSIVVVAGANSLLSPADARLAIGPGDVVVGQLETPVAATQAAFEAARAAGAAAILNPAPASRAALALLPLATVVVVNETELECLAGAPLAPDAELPTILHAMRGLRRFPEQSVVATLGARGLMALIAPDRLVTLPGHAVQVVDTTGAGDCFVGALAAGLAQGRALPDALVRANAAAALSVGCAGAGSAMPGAAEVDAFLAAIAAGSAA